MNSETEKTSNIKYCPHYAYKTSEWVPVLSITFNLAMIGAFLLVVFVSKVDKKYLSNFDNFTWNIPTHVYAQSIDLYVGQYIQKERLLHELAQLGYRTVSEPENNGELVEYDNKVVLKTRGFSFWDYNEQPMKIAVEFENDRISLLTNADSNENIDWYRLDPIRISGFYPNDENEDRIYFDLQKTPKLLIDALLLSEDRDFFTHPGFSVRGIGRAIIHNLKDPNKPQGASTITQQLVKNYFLSNHRNLLRKAEELIISILIEKRFDKNKILETYLNEVYLGQDGNRAIHGFGLASYFYFKKPLNELEIHEIGSLVSLIRGPSLYNPYLNPEDSLNRRNLILKQLYDGHKIPLSVYDDAVKQPLITSANNKREITKSLPSFTQLLKEQIRTKFSEQELNNKGLKIFTSLDPYVQSVTEQILHDKLMMLEERYKMEKNTLQGAVVVINPNTGNIVAMVGDRRANYSGFNRAINARRPIGSLIKPFIYLTALSESNNYSLFSILDDNPISLKTDNNTYWKPKNYDKKIHGKTLLYKALMKSYNLSTVNLGLALGPDKFINTVGKLNLKIDNFYPSMLLGSMELTPLDVAQMYQVLANRGYFIPISSVTAIQARTGKTYESVRRGERVFNEEDVFLLNIALQKVVEGGTAKLIGSTNPSLNAAGKTGTTDDLKDSWFVGFSQNLLAVVWVGRDDNRATSLTGATGALLIWLDIFEKIRPKPLNLSAPPNIRYFLVNQDGYQLGEGCNAEDKDGYMLWPFNINTPPPSNNSCVSNQPP